MQRVAIYTRVSSAKQEDEGTSLLTQLERCRAYAKMKNWRVVNELSDTHTGSAL